METRLHVDDGYVACPRRGEISVDWCDGCGYRLPVDSDGDRLVVVCSAPPEPRTPPGGRNSPLRDVPELWS